MAAKPPLTPQSAQITTASVAIKALTVNGKQVTLAVFRQLYEEPLYDPHTWEEVGTPWCRVNYHPDKCDKGPEHEHLVWQKGDELRRARVDRPTGELDQVPRFDAYHDAEAICIAAGGVRVEVMKVLYRDSRYLPNSRSPSGEPEVNIAVPDWGGRRAEARLRLTTDKISSWVSTRAAGNYEVSEAHLQAHPTEDDCARSRGVLGDLFHQHCVWHDTALMRWAEIRNLDQVFIAI